MATHFEEVMVSDDGTVDLTVKLYSLKVAIVSRKGVKDLGDEWKCPGIYVLVGGRADNSWAYGGKIWAYVGRANNLRGRIPQSREFEWSRGLIVRRIGKFDSAETGWLEGRIYKHLEAASVDLKNKQIPQDDTLSEPKQKDLENYVGVIQDALVLLGYDPEGHQQQTPAQIPDLEPEETKSAPIRKLLDVVPAGTQIESTGRKHRAIATVDATGIRYGGELFGSLAAAAKAVTGYAIDGWSFWCARSDSGTVVKLKDIRAQTAGMRTATKQDPRPSPRRNARSRTTPKKMSEATVKRFLARKDEGATYVELQEEFGLTQGSVYSLLRKRGRVSRR